MKRSGTADLPLHGGRVPAWLADRMTRLGAAMDNNAIADGFQIYLHSFVVSAAGEWAVVQQGMREATGMARRYHWRSAAVRDFTSDPHTGIVGEPQGIIMNLVDGRAEPARNAMLAVVHENPNRAIGEFRRLIEPRHHDVREEDVDLKRLGAAMAVAHERDLRDFASLLLVENVGPRTLQSLALIAEVVHGAPARFSDPARFSFAHGGKDGHPFPVPLKTYDESVEVLRGSLDKAKLGDSEKMDGIRRLDRFVRAIEERWRPRAGFSAALAYERSVSPQLGGRTVFDDKAEGRGKPRQLPLF